MDLNMIAQGLRMIADAIEDQAEAGNDGTPTPTPTEEEEKPKRHRRTKAEMEAARAAEAAAAAAAGAAPAAPSGPATGTASTTAPGPVTPAAKADAAPTAVELSAILTEAAKKHGRTFVAEMLAGKRVADMTDAERAEIKRKLLVLDEAAATSDTW